MAMPDPRTIAAVHHVCASDDCRYPACRCALPLIVRGALQAADEWDARKRAHADPSGRER